MLKPLVAYNHKKPDKYTHKMIIYIKDTHRSLCQFLISSHNDSNFTTLSKAYNHWGGACQLAHTQKTHHPKPPSSIVFIHYGGSNRQLVVMMIVLAVVQFRNYDMNPLRSHCVYRSWDNLDFFMSLYIYQSSSSSRLSFRCYGLNHSA
jgi:hypothetical protein